MSTFAKVLKERISAKDRADAFELMDMLSLGYDAYADETGSVALTLNTIVAIPDIYANSALLKRDPVRAYGPAADDLSAENIHHVSFVI